MKPKPNIYRRSYRIFYHAKSITGFQSSSINTMEWIDVNKVSLFVSKILVFHLCGTDMGRKDRYKQDQSTEASLTVNCLHSK